MRFEKRHWIFIAIAAVVLVLDFIFLFRTPFFTPVLVIMVSLAGLQFWSDYFRKKAEERELEERFPDFVRNLVGAIKSGMPAPNAIIHVSNTDYGSLSRHVKKLANQIEWSIPLHKALLMFANETENYVIKRAISTVIEAEMAGGNIEDVLVSVTDSVVQIKKIKQKRKASVNSQVIQSYIIFFVFLGIMIVIQNLMIPYMTGVTEQNKNPDDTVQLASTAMFSTTSTKVSLDFSSLVAFFVSLKDWIVSLNGIFMMLSLIQGTFAGLVIGKLSEGNITSGIKHSLILFTTSLFIMTLTQGFL